jgi:hemolysin activation/secretion protein
MKRTVKVLPLLLMFMVTLTEDHLAAAETNSAAGPLDVRRYVVEGDSVVTRAYIDSVFAGATGTNVSREQVQTGLGRVQKFCDDLDYAVHISVPTQVVTNGLVRLEINERPPGSEGETDQLVMAGNPVTLSSIPATNQPEHQFVLLPAGILDQGPGPGTPVPRLSEAGTNTPPTPNTTGYFHVNGYRLAGNTLLRPEQLGYLSNYTGTVNIHQVREGLNRLQNEYHDLGYPTVSVMLPKQKLTNGVVQVEIVEGKLSDIVVKGNRYFSTPNVLRGFPGLQTNIVLSTRWFEPELDMANGNPDRQIYPVVGPGPVPGTAALTLQVKDQLPLHGHVEFNNYSTPGTPDLRLDTALQYNNLWQLDHQLGFQSSFSPEEYTGLPNFYDRPMVANYSAFYRLPLGYGGDLRERYESLPADFGYSDVTHQFSLPPPTGQPSLVLYASHSSADAGTSVGPTNVLSQTSSLLVNNQTYEHTITENNGLGFRFILPLPALKAWQSTLTAGLDYKYYQAQNLTTNITIVNDLSNHVTLPITITNNPVNQLNYLPIALGWSGSAPDAGGYTTFAVNDNVFLRALSSSAQVFQSVADSKKAGGNFTTLTASMGREQNLPANWSASLKANGQWASEPLISNEQLSLDDTSGVHGYRQGEVYGDTGWRVLSALHAPAVTVGYFPTRQDEVPAELRCSLFMDYGEAYSLANAASIKEWGVGMGFFLTVGEHLSARLSLGWALHDTSLTPVGTTRVYFSLGSQF